MNRMKAKGEHPVQKKAKKGAEMVKMAKGGGIESKGKTKGKMVAMKKGGKC
jgi:site-specific recombinase